MSKKTKKGKERLDKYYQLAKEQGYRARSAFKLIQLVQKIDIFKNCEKVIDLCAAPGGWLQVARNAMPMCSKIVGVDIVPIKPMKNVLTIQADITTNKCIMMLRKEFDKNTCDIVFHDGSPNVGTAWNVDAYAQNELVLQATRISSFFLKTGGTFLTKLFRSQDYSSLLWVLQQLFNRVVVTKPEASRNVSAEIYVLCLEYKNPVKIDPKFFNPNFVFLNKNDSPMEYNSKKKKNHPESLAICIKNLSVKKRDGYTEKDLYREISATQFLKENISPTEILFSYFKLTFPPDDAEAVKIKNNPLTTYKILQLCDDLKVLGRADYEDLLKWRLRILKEMHNTVKKENLSNIKSTESFMDTPTMNVFEKENSLGVSSPSEKSLTNELQKAKNDFQKAKIDKKRKLQEKLKKLRMQKMLCFGSASILLQESDDVFQLEGAEDILKEENEVMQESFKQELEETKNQRSQRQEIPFSNIFFEDDTDETQVTKINIMAEDLKTRAERINNEAREKNHLPKNRKEKKKIAKKKWQSQVEVLIEAEDLAKACENKNMLKSGALLNERNNLLENTETDLREGIEKIHEEDNDASSDERDDDKIEHYGATPSFSNNSLHEEIRRNRWLSNELFAKAGIPFNTGVTNSGLVVVKEVANIIKKNKIGELKRNEVKKKKDFQESCDEPDEILCNFKTGSDTDKKIHFDLSGDNPVSQEGINNFDGSVKPEREPKISINSESSLETRAIGSLLLRREHRMSLLDDSYNRYTFNDEDPNSIPTWFAENEKRHMRVILPMAKKIMESLKKKTLGLSRTSKKEIEAKQRRKKKFRRLMVSSETERICTTEGEMEKKIIKKFEASSRKLRENGKKGKSYVVALKNGQKVSVGKTTRGKIRLVDKRLKKDKRNAKIRDVSRRKVRRKGH